MNEDPRTQWDARYREATPGEPAPARVLAEFAHLLPAQGKALDLACGLGGNARFLARQGLEVQAWDISPVAVEKLRQAAGAAGLAITAAARDVVADPPAAASFDVIVVSYFLERSLAPALAAALRPGGVLFYQTFTRERVSERGPSRDAFRLAPNELLALFPSLRLLAYREEGAVGRIDEGLRDEAYLVGLKAPADGC